MNKDVEKCLLKRRDLEFDPGEDLYVNILLPELRTQLEHAIPIIHQSVLDHLPDMSDEEIVNAFTDYAPTCGLFPKERALLQAYKAKLKRNDE